MARNIQTTSDTNIARLHNNFIEAIFSLSVDAKKLLLAILLHANGNDGKKIMIYRKDICDEIGIDLKELNNKHREEIIEELMTKIITIREIDNPSNWTKIQLVGKTEYKNGILETKIDEELMPYVKEAREKLFTRFHIQNIKPLTSIHAIRIYLMLKRFEDTGWYEVGIDEFKKMMELEGKYDRTFDLKRRVLEVAKKQINANTDLNMNYEFIKQGRGFKKIRFTISKNRKKVERVATKQLAKQGNFAELEERLNKEYRGKSTIGKDGLRWIVKNIKVLNENEAEITLTDTVNETTVTKKIDEIPEIFK